MLFYLSKYIMLRIHHNEKISVTTSQGLWRVTWSEASNTIWWHNNVKNTHRQQRDNPYSIAMRCSFMRKTWREEKKNTHTQKRLSIGALCGHTKHFKPNIFLFSPANQPNLCIRLLHTARSSRFGCCRSNWRTRVCYKHRLSSNNAFSD